MNGLKHLWICIVLVSFLKSVSSNFVITEGSGPWTDITKTCTTLATPEIQYGVVNKVNLDTTIDLDDGHRLWVGYTKDYEVFRFIGCIDSKNLDINDTKPHLNTNIGDCYAACGESTYFGVTVFEGETLGTHFSRCSCISKIKTWNLSTCGSSISSSEFAFPSSPNLALYTRVSDEVSEQLRSNASWNDESANCFCYVNPSQQTFQWVNCSGKDYKALCTSSLDGTATYPSNDFSVWKEAADSCVKLPNNMYIASYHQNITHNSTAQQWTANIRTMVISKGARATTGSKFRMYGHIVRKKGGFVLEFGEPDAEYRALCFEGTNERRTDMTGNVAGIIAGVLVPVVIIAAVAVIVIVILKKRRRPAENKDPCNSRQNISYDPHFDSNPIPNDTDDYHEIGDVDVSVDRRGYEMVKGDSSQSNNNHQCSSLKPDQSQQAVSVTNISAKNDGDYDLATDPENQQNNGFNHQYFTPEKDLSAPSQNSDIQTNGDYDFPPDAYATVSKVQKDTLEANNDYDFATENDVCESKDQEHVYNKTRDVQDTSSGTYDHLENGLVCKPSAEGHYDTTSPWGQDTELDPDYDHTVGFQGNKTHLNNQTNDPYNKLC